MKVLFLDNDGVICLENNWGSRTKKFNRYCLENKIASPPKFKDRPVTVRFDDFDQGAIKVLNEVLEKTGAEIVVSSDWKRFATVEELGEYYESQGIIKKPIDRTSNMEEFDDSGASLYKWKSWTERMRIVEIKKYLEDHPEITHWVAIDDMNMSREVHDVNGLDNFVHTFIGQGITRKGVSEELIKYLS